MAFLIIPSLDFSLEDAVNCLVRSPQSRIGALK
jgi:hypothetical protein